MPYQHTLVPEKDRPSARRNETVLQEPDEALDRATVAELSTHASFEPAGCPRCELGPAIWTAGRWNGWPIWRVFAAEIEADREERLWQRPATRRGSKA
jgi:hypothetical protein